ncbi:HEAT repeat-containing protein 5A [Orchesella cincta]|uniref:HEAT repeat-containing protein 5A n=1 Tax=Orchesella cincta TaxID=48709 RepID=A0A1D2M3X8_ORCCI|nr:HEAT repeat-containing protein 5A [Orchesella cincta]
MSFMGATSNSDSLRLEGLLNLKTIIEKFASIRDPDFPSVSILNSSKSKSAPLHPLPCRHRLSPWAQVFVTAVENGLKEKDCQGLNEVLRQTTTKDPLLRLVELELNLLCPLWLSALRDRALIELPPEFAPQLPREGASNAAAPSQQLERFYLVFGGAMEALCKQPFSEIEGGDMETATMFLKSLWALRSSHWPRDVISHGKPFTIELCCVLHRQLKEDDKDPAGTEKELNSEEEATGEELQASPSNKYVVMSVLEVVFCLLMPNISTHNSHVSGFQVKSTGTPQENDKLLGETGLSKTAPRYLLGASVSKRERAGDAESGGGSLRRSLRRRIGASVLASFTRWHLGFFSFSMGGGEEREEQGDAQFILESLRAIQILVQLVDSWAKCTLKSGEVKGNEKWV